MRFLDVADLGAAQRERAEQIYEDNFPPELRSPFAELLADVALAYLDEEPEDGRDGGRVVGLAVLRRMPSTGWVFLRYFVVGEHGRGLGSRMWTDLCARFADERRIVLDVEHPDEPGTDDHEAHERRRRIAFYERLGVVVLPVAQWRPPQPGAVAPPMLLLSRPTGDDAVAPTDAEVARIVVATYLDRYGLDAQDPVVVRTLQASGLTP